MFFAGALILIISAFFVFFDNSQNEIKFAQAGAGDNVSGFAWSSNIGWISFNSDDCNNNGTIYSGTPSGCPSGSPYLNYGVRIDNDTGNFSGYAWSSNVGWISFNRCGTDNNCSTNDGDTGDPPNSPTDDPGNGTGPIAKVDLVSAVPGQITGWAKILSLGDDGWIRFSYSEGGPYTFPIPFPFSEISVGGLSYDAGIDTATGDLFGWAWNGNDDGTGIGWISLSDSNAPAYSVHANINRTPEKPTLTGATLIDKCSNILGMQLAWEFNDPDTGDYQSAYRVQIKILHIGVWGSILDSGWQTPGLPTPEFFNFSEVLGHNIQYNTDYEYRVNVRDHLGAESDWSNPMTFSTPDYKYPEAYFNWTPSSPSAGQEILFSTVGAVKSRYYTLGNTQHNCSDSSCAYQWSFSYVDSSGNPQTISGSSDTASTTAVIFPQKASVTARLNVVDIASPPGYNCSTSTIFGLKSKLPTWVETK